MQPLNSETTSPPLLSLDERLALLWVRDNQPCMPPLSKVANRVRVSLLQRGLIQFDPKRHRFDSVTYVLTEAGVAALS